MGCGEHTNNQTILNLADKEAPHAPDMAVPAAAARAAYSEDPGSQALASQILSSRCSRWRLISVGRLGSQRTKGPMSLCISKGCTPRRSSTVGNDSVA